MVFDTHDQIKTEMVSMLAPDGTYAGPNTPPLDDEQVRRIYENMMTMRIYDRKAVSLQRQGRFGTYAQMEGQEASLIASTYPLQPQDWMVTTTGRRGPCGGMGCR